MQGWAMLSSWEGKHRSPKGISAKDSSGRYDSTTRNNGLYVYLPEHLNQLFLDIESTLMNASLVMKIGRVLEEDFELPTNSVTRFTGLVIV
jgi:hypothetical protein